MQMMKLTLEPESPPLRADSHGFYRVGDTRVSLEVLLESFFQGATPEEIVDRYPSVPLADVYATIAYYLQHKDAVDEYLRDVESAEAEAVRQIQARFPDQLRRHWLAGRNPVVK